MYMLSLHDCDYPEPTIARRDGTIKKLQAEEVVVEAHEETF